MIAWLDGEGAPAFPPVKRALRDPSGLLAAGGALRPEWLLEAYRHGIFPWFNPGDPILWWSPDPRMVLFPQEMKISHSLRKRLKRGEFEIRLDTAFREVMLACAAPRTPGGGTWITREMVDAYCRMHELGHAHSVEAWADGELAGGLYGMALGRVFFGESMFARRTDASKAALAHLARLLAERGFEVIDCQMVTSHLASLGGREIPRATFAAGLARWTAEGNGPGRWPVDAARFDWS